MTGYQAFDKAGNTIKLGMMVSFVDNSLKNPVEKMGPIEELTFKIDGTVIVRISGYKKKPQDASHVRAVEMSERERLIVSEFAARGVRLSFEEAKRLSSMLSVPAAEQPVTVDPEQMLDEPGIEVEQ